LRGKIAVVGFKQQKSSNNAKLLCVGVDFKRSGQRREASSQAAGEGRLSGDGKEGRIIKLRRIT
jgi:hypothetical protein